LGNLLRAQLTRVPPGACARRFMIVGSFDHIATETVRDHDLGQRWGWVSLLPVHWEAGADLGGAPGGQDLDPGGGPGERRNQSQRERVVPLIGVHVVRPRGVPAAGAVEYPDRQ